MGSAEPRHFLDLLDEDPDQILALAEKALAAKRGEDIGRLDGRVLVCLFFSPSLRTRTSFASAMARLGGSAQILAPGEDSWVLEHRDGVVMDGGGQEHVREAAPVLSRYADAIGIRRCDLATTSSETADVTGSWEDIRGDAFHHAFAAASEVPVLNLESNLGHPCQGLADLVTLRERVPEPRAKKYVLTWAWHPKSLALATPHSQLQSPCFLGMDVTIARPDGWDLDDEVVERSRALAESAGGSLSVTDDVDAAVEGATVVCAKSWGSRDFYGRFEEEPAAKADLRDKWIVDEGKMAAAADDAFFMHCLPLRRGVIATDGVLDGPNSAVVDQAENRLWAQAALLLDRIG